jgi:outer membrane protein TolC
MTPSLGRPTLAAPLLLLLFAPPAAAERLTLEEALDLAIRGQPRLAAATAQIDAAHARVGRAFSAYLPSINLTLQERWDGSNAAVVTRAEPLTGKTLLDYPFVNGLRTAVGATFDLRLFDFGRTGGAVAAARASEAQARTDLEVIGLDVRLAVFEAYVDALRGGAQIAVQQLAVEQVERQLQRARALYKATLRPEIDVLSAETQLAQAQIRRLQATNAAENALVALRNAIGRGAPARIEPREPPLVELPIEHRPIEELVAEAVAVRGELRSLDLQIDAAIETLRSQRGDYFPIFSLGSSANAAVSDTRLQPIIATALATFTITQPLFQGLQTRRAVQEARANVELARQNRDVVRLRIVQEVESARLAVDLARASLGVAVIARRQAERQLVLAQARYESRVGTFVELNDARNGLIVAMGQEVDARFTLMKGRGQLLRRLGRGVLW